MKQIIFLFGFTALMAACSSSSSENDQDAAEVAEASDGSESYIVDTEQSSIDWYAEKITGWNHSGNVAIKAGKLEVENNVITAGNFVIDMSSVSVGNIEDPEKEQKFLGHIASADFFDIANHPTASFEITSVTADSITGNLTIKAITHAITAPYVANQTEGNYNLKSSFEVDRAKYDVQYGSGSFFDDLGDNLIKDAIKFSVELTSKK